MAPYGLFQAADGQVAIAPSNDQVYFKLLDALGLSHLRTHPDFLTNRDRFERRSAINALIEEQTLKHSIAHWLEVLNAAGVPCGRVMNLKEVFDDPQIRHQQMRVTIDHPRHGPLDVLGFPIKFTDDPCRMHRVPPDLGADTKAILRRAGLRRERDRRASCEACHLTRASGIGPPVHWLCQALRWPPLKEQRWTSRV